MSELLIEQLSAFGDYSPSIPFADGIDKNALIEGDDNPLFVTLPIAEVGAKSKNGRIYNKQIVEAIVNQVNTFRNGGNKGHLKTEDRSSKFDLPVLQWVGATLDDNGKAYGKAYVPKYASDVREYLKNAKATRSQIATSIYGMAKTDGDLVTEISLESIDLADPFRAGVSAAVATPILTQEMNDTGDNPMPENNNQDVISELRNDRNQAIQELADVRVELKASQAQAQIISELTELLDTQDVFKAVSEMQKTIQEWQPLVTGVKALGEKPLVAIQEMQETIAELEHASLLHNIVDAINEKVKFEGARPVIAEMMGIERDDNGVGTLTRQYDSAEDAIKRLDSILEREQTQEMIKSMVYKASGGRVTTHKSYDKDWRDQFIKLGEEKARSIVGGKS